MLPDKYRYIAIEGPIGVGKTTLAHRIAGRFGCSLLLENPEANPFLPKFYQHGARYALATQLFFLFQRVAQLEEMAQFDLFQRATVADFMLDKDPLFAELTLADDEYALYRQIYRHLRIKAPAPDLVIYLQASPEVLAERVRRRGHAWERGLGADYLARLAERYSRHFLQYEASPLLIVNCDKLNLVEGDADFDLLLRRVAEMRGAREFFNRGD